MDIKVKKPVMAYYMIEKNGGYEVFRVHIEEGVVLETSRLSDPDAWDQSIGVLEMALAKQFE